MGGQWRVLGQIRTGFWSLQERQLECCQGYLEWDSASKTHCNWPESENSLILCNICLSTGMNARLTIIHFKYLPMKCTSISTFLHTWHQGLWRHDILACNARFTPRVQGPNHGNEFLSRVLLLDLFKVYSSCLRYRHNCGSEQAEIAGSRWTQLYVARFHEKPWLSSSSNLARVQRAHREVAEFWHLRLKLTSVARQAQIEPNV